MPEKTPTVYRGFLPTAQRMREIIIEASRLPAIRYKALKIIQPSQPGLYMNELKLLFEFVRDRIRYIGDPYTEDLLQWPQITLECKAGDCNNRAVLLGSLARSIGFPTQLVFSFATDSPDLETDFPQHVWLEADVNKGEEAQPLWITLETTPAREPIMHTTTLKMDFGAAFPAQGYRHYILVDE